MKKIFALLVSALFVVACGSSKDDDPAPVVDPDVTLPSLDNKSGGVYYAMSKESFRIFKLNLKNGDDKMICQMFDGLEYITIEGEATSWKPGQSLTYYAFEKDGVKLSMAINATDLTSFTFESEGKVEELITRKSSVKSPVLVYFDSDMKSYDKGSDDVWETTTLASTPGDMTKYRTENSLDWYKKDLGDISTVTFLFNAGAWTNKLQADGFNKTPGVNFVATKSVWVRADGTVITASLPPAATDPDFVEPEVPINDNEPWVDPIN